MASIQKIKSPLTGEISYRAQIRVKGRSESLTFPLKAEAKEWAASIETAIREGKHFPHAAAQRVTFDTLAKAYEEKGMGDFTDEKQKKTRIQQVTWWSGQFKGRPVAEVTADAIKLGRDACAAETFTRGNERKDKKTGQMVQPKQYKRTPATVNRYVAALSAVLTYAINEHVPPLLTVNPVKGISRRKEPKGRTRFLSDDERIRLLDACAKSAWSPLRALVLLAITTGARRTEMTSLMWKDVNTTTGRALVQKSKNGDQRTLILTGEALKALQALEAARAEKPKDERSEFVFPNPSGVPGAVKFFDTDWHAALDAAGFKDKDFRFHDLRHTTASYLAAQGRSLLEIADVLGHKTLTMVQRYSHLVVGHKAGVIESMVAAKGL
jgi:integrase